MALFVYKATDRSGRLIQGTMEGKSEDVVVNKLRNSRLLPVSIKPEEAKNGLTRDITLANLFGNVRKKDIVNFTQQLSTLLDAGLSLDRSLTILIELCEKERLKGIIEHIQKTVHSGSSFADSLSKYPRAFSRLYINMVRAGEEGGVLEIIMQRLADFLEKTEQLRENIKSAMVYPALLTLVGGASVIVLLTFVIPKFALIFSDMGEAIPLPTLVLLKISGFLTGYWWAILLSTLLFISLIKIYSSTESGRLLIDSLMLRIPLLGGIQEKIQVARFSRTLGTLMKSGVPLLKAISITGDIITNTIIRRSMNLIQKRIKEGEGISEPLKESGVFPALSTHMIRVGEETGNLEEMLLKVSNIYDTDVENSVKRFISLLEPMLILFMGIIVGFIVLSMLMAIFSMNDLPL